MVGSVSEAGDEYGDEGFDNEVKEGNNEENAWNEGIEGIIEEKTENTGNEGYEGDTTRLLVLDQTRIHQHLLPAPDPSLVLGPTPPKTARSIAKTMTAGYVKAKHIYGSTKVPEHIINTIAEWHSAHLVERPPFIYLGTPCPRWPWTVFDRNGNQLLFSMFRVYTPIAYYFTFVLYQDGTSKLVAKEQFSPGQHLLFGWDSRNAFESEPCAVLSIKKNAKDIVFDEGWFHNFTKSSNGKTKSAGVSTTTAQNAARPDRTKRRSERLNRIGGSESTCATTHSIQQRDNYSANDNGSDPAAYSPSEPKSEQVQARPTKRRRIGSPVARPASSAPAPTQVAAPAQTTPPPTLPAPPTSTPTSINSNRVAFALISSGVICHLPTDECTSSRYLFKRGREFLCTRGLESSAKFLVCQVPSESEGRMLYEGDETSFKRLLNDVKSLQRDAGVPLVVEIKHPDWWISSTPS